MDDVFEVQDEIARSIAQTFRINLSPQEEKRLPSKPTQNSVAYDYYLRGRSYARRESLEFALQMYEQAIKLDPNFALAHAGIAYICGIIHEIREHNPKWVERGDAACNKALQLDPNLRKRSWLAHEFPIRNANTSKPSNSLSGRLPSSPTAKGFTTCWAACISLRADFRRRRNSPEKAVEANGDDYNVFIPIVNALQRLGRTARTQALSPNGNACLEHQLELVPEDVRARSLLAADYANMGRAEDAVRHLEMTVALRPNDSNVLYNAACTYTVLGRRRRRWICCGAHLRPDTANVDWPRQDPDLSSLHADPEFLKLFPPKIGLRRFNRRGIPRCRSG